MIVTNNGNITEHQIDSCHTISKDDCDSQKILNTNGAGDAFAGGFLVEFMDNQTVDECVRTGIKIAMENIAQ